MHACSKGYQARSTLSLKLKFRRATASTVVADTTTTTASGSAPVSYDALRRQVSELREELRERTEQVSELREVSENLSLMKAERAALKLTAEAERT